jgi:phosphoglycerol transferase MdoB-like AlkP superfamily enzyme
MACLPHLTRSDKVAPKRFNIERRRAMSLSFGIHPFFLIAGTGLLISLVFVVFAWRAKSAFATVLLLLFALIFTVPSIYLFFALHPEVVDGRFRTYKAFYSDIKVGMTRDQVIAAMQARYPQSGKRQRPKIMDDEADRLGFFMNPEASREPNCEGIFLSLTNGSVASKTYSPD